jgi:hypothetical protein
MATVEKVALGLPSVLFCLTTIWHFSGYGSETAQRRLRSLADAPKLGTWLYTAKFICAVILASTSAIVAWTLTRQHLATRIAFVAASVRRCRHRLDAIQLMSDS